MKKLLLVGVFLSVNLFAGGLSFQPEYRGTHAGAEIILQVESGRYAKLIYVPHLQTFNGTLSFLGETPVEGVFELALDGVAEKFKISTTRPCSMIDSLTLITPSGAQVLLVKN